MNVLVLTSSDKVIFRPDTSWDKDSADLYLPDYVEALSFSPVVYTRITKPGKSVAEKFVGRYYEAVGFGLLLYPTHSGSEEDFAQGLCLEGGSRLAVPSLDKALLDGSFGRTFTLQKDGREIYSALITGSSELCKAVTEVSKYCYLRVGDYVAAELQPRRALCAREDGPVSHICGSLGEEVISDFKILF